MLAARFTFLVVLTGCLIFGASGQEQTIAKDSKKTTSHNKSGTESNPLVVKMAQPSDSEKETQSKREERKENLEKELNSLTGKLADYTNDLSRFTSILVGIAFLQLVVFWWQGKQLRKTVDIGREEFISTHRPKIVLRRFSIVEDSVTQRLGVEYVISNIGGTKANIAAMSHRIWFPESDENLPPIPPYNDRTDESFILESGESIRRNYFETDSQILFRYQMTSAFIRTRKSSGGMLIPEELLFLGYVVYRDGLNKSRETAFLRRLDFGTERFSAIEHADYEYQD